MNELNSNYTDKVNNQGRSSQGRLSAQEFIGLVHKINELVANANKTVYLSEAEYEELERNNQLQDDVEYNIYEE